jgi:hypothetical protein
MKFKAKSPLLGNLLGSNTGCSERSSRSPFDNGLEFISSLVAPRRGQLRSGKFWSCGQQLRLRYQPYVNLARN